MIARVFIPLLLIIILPDVYLWLHRLRRPGYSWVERLLWLTPSALMIVFSSILAVSPSFVPDDIYWARLYIALLGVWVVPKLVYVLCSAIGLAICRLAHSRRNWGRLVGIGLAGYMVYAFVYGYTIGFADIEVKHVTLAVDNLPKEFDGLRVKEALGATDLSLNMPVYHSHSKELREKLAEEMLYIVHNPKEPPFHLIGHLYLFLDYLLQSAKSTKIVQNGRMSDYYIKEAMNYIEQNFQNNISIEDIAAVCGINRSYFGKIFKNSVGQSPQEFLMNYRMIKATELLKLTSLSIADIGSAVGYENQLHFSRAFKNIYGVSPREWRNQHK